MEEFGQTGEEADRLIKSNPLLVTKGILNGKTSLRPVAWEIAEQLGCTRQNISSIVRGRTRR